MKQADQQKKQILRNISYEIRTLIIIITGQAEQLRMLLKNPALRKKMDSIITASQNPVFMVDDILDSSMIETGRFTLNYEDCSLYEIVAETRLLALPRIQETGSKLFIHISPKACRENSAASRLLGSISLRFALHGRQRGIGERCVLGHRTMPDDDGCFIRCQGRLVRSHSLNRPRTVAHTDQLTERRPCAFGDVHDGELPSRLHR